MAKSELELNPYSLEGFEGIGDTTRKQLEANGISTMYDVVALSPTAIAQYIKGDDDKAIKLFEFCKKHLTERGLMWERTMSATDLLKLQNSLPSLSTGCKELDYLLDGGLKPRTITEFYGENASGKTQLGATLAILCQTPIEQKGLRGSGEKPPICIIIDTENKYHPKRLQQIVIAKGLAKDELEAEKFLDNIKIMQPKSVSEQVYAVAKVREWLSNKLGIKLLIIDSISSLIRGEYTERGNAWLKKDMMNKMFLELRGIAEIFNIPVVLMNQIYNSPEAQANQYMDGDKAYGGNILGHALYTRIKLERTQAHITTTGGFRYLKNKARIIKSPIMGEEEVQFFISNEGICDIPDNKPKKIENELNQKL